MTEVGHDARPFAVRLDELRRAHGLTFRALEARLQACATPGERGVTNSHLAALTTGRRRPTPPVVELIARAFDVAPQSFVEWRLWQVQELFDPERSDGFDAAVAQLLAFFDDSSLTFASWTRAKRARRVATSSRCSDSPDLGGLQAAAAVASELAAPPLRIRPARVR